MPPSTASTSSAVRAGASDRIAIARSTAPGSSRASPCAKTARRGQLPQGRAGGAARTMRALARGSRLVAREGRGLRAARASACWRSPGARATVEQQLTLLGLVLFWDPPRPEVPDADRAGPLRRHPCRDDHRRPSRDRAGHRAADWHSRRAGAHRRGSASVLDAGPRRSAARRPRLRARAAGAEAAAGRGAPGSRARSSR